MSMSFKEMTNEDNFNNLLVVDGLNLAFRFKHSNKKAFASEFLLTVRSLAKSYKCKKVIVCGDGGSDYRHNIYPEYKANRKVLREKQTEQEAKDFKDFLVEFGRAFDMCTGIFLTMKYKGVEADDIAAYIAQEVDGTFDKTWLISSDKDWDLLLSDTVSRFSTHARKEFTIENWNDHYEYEPDMHMSIKALMGDKGDNVPGVDGIGAKRAFALIRQYGSALDILDQLPINDSKKYIQNLNEFGDKILLNYELMDLPGFCEDALLDNVNEINKKIWEYIDEDKC